MNRYFYRAKDKNGKLVTGEVEASSREAAARLIRSKGLFVISINPARISVFGLLTSFRDRITSGDVTTFTRQLATMINAGLAITDSLSILREQSKGNMKKVISQVLADIEGGESLSAACGKHPSVFSPTFVALLKSGEVGGVLDEVLARLADTLEKQGEFKGRVKTALIYPAIIVTGMLIVGFIMMVFVVPRLTDLYTEFEAELPLPTRILMGISSLLIALWPVLLLLGVGGFYAYSGYRKTTEGRRKTDEFLFKLPIIGELQKQIILTEMTRTLSLMVGAGVSILEALSITSGVVGNVIISDALKDVATQVEKGFPVAFAFAKHPEAFPFILSQMVAVGEETGKMDEVLIKVSHIFEVESDQKVKALTAAVEPLVMVLLGLGVGFLVIAVILPIYNLTSEF
ncbi:type II secretion system F family protein [Candidatus Woesebacteria bacterium]|nr:type II secretion system F family protein [Candidatus Woesebacteria bacterium]